MPENIDATAAANGQRYNIYSTAEKGNPDGQIVYDEARNWSRTKSVFDDVGTDATRTQKAVETVKQEAKNRNMTVNGNIDQVIKKYLGSNSLDSKINDWAGFKTINYNHLQNVSISENTQDFQQRADNFVEQNIKDQVAALSNDVVSAYNSALERAVTQAENELLGDADLVGYLAPNKTNKKGISSAQFNLLAYTRSEGDETVNVAQFTSSHKDAQMTEGFNQTLAFLLDNGAKPEEKVVNNGEKMFIYKIKIDGDTQYVAVDDAGQLHLLDRNKSFLRQSLFTTQDAVQDATYQSRNDTVNGNNVPAGARLETKNIGGKRQTVLVWGHKGREQYRVIDHNDATGLTVSADLKIGSDYEQGDKDKIGTAIANICITAKKYITKYPEAHITVDDQSMSGTTSSVTILENKYTLDPEKHVEAYQTIQLIQGELDRLDRAQRREDERGPITNDVETNITIDYNAGRDTNLAENHVGNVLQQGEGLNDLGSTYHPETGTYTSRTGTEKTNSVNHALISTKAWSDGGWRASANRQREAQILQQMNAPEFTSTAVEYVDESPIPEGAVIATIGNKKYAVTYKGSFAADLKDDREFAERYLRSQGKDPKDYDIDLLAKHFRGANTSFFDQATGEMLRNCDFTYRINFPNPDKLDMYLKKPGTGVRRTSA